MSARRWLAVTAAWIAGGGLAVANPNGEPALERCLVSLVEEAEVPAQEAGVLAELLIREGDVVEKGKPIARIKDDQPQMERKKALAELEQAVVKSENDVDERYAVKAEEVSQAAFEKAEIAHRRSEGAVPDIERKRLKLEWEKAELQIEQARRELKLAKLAAHSKQVEVEAAENAIERRRIVAPLDGEVVKVAKHVGEWMQPGDRLAHVVRTDTLRVEGYIDAAKWDPDEIRDREVTVEVDLANGRRETFSGRIAFVSPLVESGGEYRAFADVPNRRGPPGGQGSWLLRAGQQVKMTIHTTRPPVKR